MRISTTSADSKRSREASALQISWLHRELADWRATGIIDDDQAAAIAGRYHAVSAARRFSLGRLLLVLGGVFVGIGVIWLVAANLDELSPGVRFGIVVLFWLATLVGGELLAHRMPAITLGVVRLIAAMLLGALIFQAAQSLQVPAYEPWLVGLWSAGALTHAYVFRAYSPLIVGVATGVGFWVWQSLADALSGLNAVVGLGTAAVLAAALGVLHAERDEGFSHVWRTVAAGLALVTLFLAAIPFLTPEGFAWTSWLMVSAALAAVAAITAVAVGGTARIEAVGALGVLALGVLLVMWDTGTDTSHIEAADWLHATISVLAYVALAVALAALGTMRDNQVITVIAMVGLVIFTTFQAFAVFAPILSGGVLFLVLGLVFIGTGFGFDRARREIRDALSDDRPHAPKGAHS